MPNFIANRFKNAIASMAAKVLDATDQDGLGIYAVADGNTKWYPYLFRKNSTATADGDLIVDGTIGKWVKFAPVYFNTTAPSFTPVMDMIYIQTSTSTGVDLIYAAQGGSAFELMGSRPVSRSVDPDRVADYEGQVWVNNSTREVFIASSTSTIANWLSVGIGAT